MLAPPRDGFLPSLGNSARRSVCRVRSASTAQERKGPERDSELRPWGREDIEVRGDRLTGGAWLWDVGEVLKAAGGGDKEFHEYFRPVGSRHHGRSHKSKGPELRDRRVHAMGYIAEIVDDERRGPPQYTGWVWSNHASESM